MSTFIKSVRNTVKHWYIPAIIGALFIILGIYVFTVPESTYKTLATLFSLSFLISGVLETYFSLRNKNELEGWGRYLASGIFNLIIGIILISKSGMAAAILPFFIGFTLLFRSFQGIGFAMDLKNRGELRWGNLAIASILGIIFSFLLIVNPLFTGMYLVIFTALAFIFTGIKAIVLSFQLRKLKKIPKKINAELRQKIEALKKEYYEEMDKNEV